MSRLQDEPFALDDPTWQLWLSSQEWALLYALWLTVELRAEAAPVDFTTGMRRELIKLIRDHGYRPTGVRIDEDDNVYRSCPLPTCETNAIWLGKLRSGRAPDIAAAFQVAIELCEANERLQLLKGRLVQMARDIHERRAAFIAQRPPEVARQYREIVDALEAQEDVN